VLHAGTLLTLIVFADGWNSAVWPWNVALAASGFALIAPWRGGLGGDLVSAAPAPRLLALALLFAPATFYAGLADAYPAHQLYSAGTARATVYCPAGCQANQDPNATWTLLNVPLPPEPRLFAETFRLTCRAGDMLEVSDPFPAPWTGGERTRLLFCPAGSLPPSHP
jgi:hypothetical protein